MMTPNRRIAAGVGAEARPYCSPLPRLRIGSSLTRLPGFGLGFDPRAPRG